MGRQKCLKSQKKFLSPFVLADDILHSLLMDEENLSMDMVWKVVDLYKEAIILTREKDVEMEAIALSRLGNVNDKILKDKLKAKAYFRRSIQLALSLHPRIFDAEGRFLSCYETVECDERRHCPAIIFTDNVSYNKLSWKKNSQRT